MLKIRRNKVVAIITCIIINLAIFYVIPKNDNKVYASGVDNIVARANYLYNLTWVAQKNVAGWDYTFVKGKTYRIPYGQAGTVGKYIGYDVSVDDFLTATTNPSSVFYTKQSYYSGTKTKSTYYATDCSGFVSYCWGVTRTTTSNWESLNVTNIGKVNSSNFSKIQKGDALNWAGHHVVLVTAVNSDGSVEITEQTPPQLKRTKYTKEKLISAFSTYTIYRYNKRDSVPPAPNSVINVKFHRNLNSDDTKSVTEKFTTGVSNQKFGYTTDGTGRYGTMNDASVGFGQWSNPGCKMLGWSTNKNATSASLKTYSSVIDSWIAQNAPSINLYAVWEKSSTTVKFHRNLNSDDTTSVTEKFTTGVSNQKFGYTTDGTGRYGTMNDASVGFGQWSNPGCKMLGWSTDKYATTASLKTYANVIDSWIAQNAPSINLYAVWEKSLSSITIDTPPTYTIYPKNGKIDATGLVLNAIYSDGSTEKISEGFTVEADLSTVGTVKATVSFGGKTATYNVEVKNYFAGSGTQNDPYKISKPEDLLNLSEVVNAPNAVLSFKKAYYEQTDDIDMAGIQFTPIGIFYSPEIKSLNNEIAFDGIYNGGKHSIINLSVNWDSEYSGLFGRTQRHSVISNLSVYGDIVGAGICSGGIVGEIGYNGIVKNCSFNGTVRGSVHAGGIAGTIQGGGHVNYCYVNADVTADSISDEEAIAGGIVGRPRVGNAKNSTDADITNSYFVGNVTGEVAGAIVGKTIIGTDYDNTVTYSSNCYLKESGLEPSGDASVKGNEGLALSEDDMKTSSIYLLNNPDTYFSANWRTSFNDGYPVFEWQLSLRGDVNNDREFNVSDVVVLQKWLIAVPNTKLPIWRNADLYEDERIDVFDLILLKRLLINS